jgi:penicillin-binding protein 2
MRRKHHVTAHRSLSHRRTAAPVVHRSYVRRVSLTTKATLQTTRSAVIRGPIIAGGPWVAPTFADSTSGDFVDGEDLDVRRAAVQALGPYNGSVVVTDASTGRILTMVNQKLALSSGFQPCSTIKVSVALTALHEKLISPSEKLNGIDLRYALAHSNNYFFATLGTRLGYEKVSSYAHLLGYGEKAGLDVPGEQAGAYPPAPPKNGGMGMLTSFGEEITQTPLELAALMGALANGGTLYYLQYPRTPWEAQHFVPRVKRDLGIKDLIPEVKPGMLGAVEFGTARRAYHDQPIAGKTGTCTGSHTHLGWFGAFNDSGQRKLVVVLLLTGGRGVAGPVAAQLAGEVYKQLEQENYFAKLGTAAPVALIAPTMCCTR